MSQPGNGPRRRRDVTRRRPTKVDALGVISRLRRNDRALLGALVTLVRYADPETLRAVRVVMGLTLRVARRRGTRPPNPVTACPSSFG